MPEALAPIRTRMQALPQDCSSAQVSQGHAAVQLSSSFSILHVGSCTNGPVPHYISKEAISVAGEIQDLRLLELQQSFLHTEAEAWAGSCPALHHANVPAGSFAEISNLVVAKLRQPASEHRSAAATHDHDTIFSVGPTLSDCLHVLRPEPASQWKPGRTTLASHQEQSVIVWLACGDHANEHSFLIWDTHSKDISRGRKGGRVYNSILSWTYCTAVVIVRSLSLMSGERSQIYYQYRHIQRVLRKTQQTSRDPWQPARLDGWVSVCLIFAGMAESFLVLVSLWWNQVIGFMHRLSNMPEDSVHAEILRDNIADAQEHPSYGNWAGGIVKQYSRLGMVSPF